MAKNKSTDDGHRSGAVREGSKVNGHWVKRDADTGCLLDETSAAAGKGVRREILFPTEPSTIAHSKIDRAVERVVSRKK